jgi:hypothetical protein
MNLICCDLSLLIFFGEAWRFSKLSYDCVRGRIDDGSLTFDPKKMAVLMIFLDFILENKNRLLISL